MLFHKIKTLLPLVIVYLELATFAQGIKTKNAGKCTHGGILSGVFLNAGVRPRNDTIFSGIASMEDCISKCCKVSRCDLAMKIGSVCHAVRCQDDDSCQISHRRRGSQVRAEIAFITKGEDTKPEAKVKPTAPNTRFSSSTNKHQSSVNKRPTAPLLSGISRFKPREAKNVTPVQAANTVPVLQMFKKGEQGLANVIASKLDTGSGAIDDSSKQDEDHSGLKSAEGAKDEDEDSGSSSISSGESSGSTSNSVRDDTGSKDVSTANNSEDSYVLPNVVRVSPNTPSASRSAIPLSSGHLGLSLGLPLINYSHEDSSDEKDENGGSTSYDNDDDDNNDDDDDEENEEEKGPNKNDVDDGGSVKPVKDRGAQSLPNRNQLGGPSQRPLATTKSSLYKTTRGRAISGMKTKLKSREMFTHGERVHERHGNFVARANERQHTTESSFHNKGNQLENVWLTNGLIGKTEASRGQPQSTSQYVRNGAYDYSHREALGGKMQKTDFVVIKKQVAKESKDKEISKGKLQQDFNDVTRAVITKMKSKSDEKIDAKQESQKLKSKKTKFATNSHKIVRTYAETPLQRELSTLFAKDTAKTSFIKASKKSSFDKLKKLQEQRDRKRHRFRGQPSLSILYTKNYGKTKTKFFIHRFSDWHGWTRDQLLNVPRENAKCKRGVTIHGATLRGGILAGDFKTIGIVDNQHTCVSSCCKNKRCDVALMLGKECFNVKCYSSNLCGLAPAAAIFDEVTPIITYVRGHVQKRSTDEQAEQIDEQIINEQDEGHEQLLKWLKIFI